MLALEFGGAFLGVTTQPLTDQLRKHFGVSQGGVLVAEVEADSPAAKAGLRAGDVILQVGDQAVEDPPQLARAVRRYQEGEQATITIMRDGRTETLSVTFAQLPEGGLRWWGWPEAEIERFEPSPFPGEGRGRFEWKPGRHPLLPGPELEQELERLRRELDDLRRKLEQLQRAPE
jgi:membrane-associated protease RseP (regulator of RpoE activity)